MTIITNGHARPLVSWQGLPADVKPDFDYLDEEERYGSDFFHYRGSWYHLGEFEGVSGLSDDHEFKGWDGFLTDSYFSATIIRWIGERHAEFYSDHYGYVIVGRWFT